MARLRKSVRIFSFVCTCHGLLLNSRNETIHKLIMKKKRNSLKYKCIIFDCDGILVDSEEISNSVLIKMANEVGIEIKMEYALENFAGKSLKNCFAHIEKRIKKPLPNTFEKEYRKPNFFCI